VFEDVLSMTRRMTGLLGCFAQDVKLVKKHLWGCLEKDLASLKESKASQATHSFQDLVSRTVSAMPKGDCENLSAAASWLEKMKILLGMAGRTRR
jgi:hypothetical protein